MASVGVVTTFALIWYGSWVYDYLKNHPQEEDIVRESAPPIGFSKEEE